MSVTRLFEVYIAITDDEYDRLVAVFASALGMGVALVEEQFEALVRRLVLRATESDDLVRALLAPRADDVPDGRGPTGGSPE